VHYQDQDPEKSLYLLVKHTSKAFRERLNRNFAKAGHGVKMGRDSRILPMLFTKTKPLLLEFLILWRNGTW
jgi:hypothetical protein